MKKIIQILAITLQLLAVGSYIGIIKIAAAFQNGTPDWSVFITIIIIAGVTQTLSLWLKQKYPEEVENAEDVIYTKKELEEKKKGVNKNPLFVKILLVVPIIFFVILAIWTLFGK